MYRQIKECVLVPAVIIIALLTAGCGNSAAPGTETAPAISPVSQSPSQNLSPSPETSLAGETGHTEPPSPDYGILALESCYFMDGDPGLSGYVFMEDGAVIDTDEVEWSYEIDGENIRVGKKSDPAIKINMRLIDEYTILELEHGIIYIREGGEGFGTGWQWDAHINRLFFEIPYYRDGLAGETSFCFFNDGAVIINAPETYVESEYCIENEEILIGHTGDEDSPGIVLVILNMSELADPENAGIVYAPEGAYEQGLVIGANYYMDGDLKDGKLRFIDESGFEFGDQSGEIEKGLYTFDGSIVTIELGGESVSLSFVNSFILGSDWGLVFIRYP